jgi:haloacetate dehalogenase
MNRIADLFPGFAEHRIPTEGAEIFRRTGRSGPPLLPYGQPQPHVCSHKIAREPVRLRAACEGIDRKLDKADLTAGCKITCPTVVLWASECLGRDGAKPIEAWHAWRTKVSGAAVRTGHFLAEENAQATPAALIQAHAGSD